MEIRYYQIIRNLIILSVCPFSKDIYCDSKIRACVATFIMKLANCFIRNGHHLEIIGNTGHGSWVSCKISQVGSRSILKERRSLKKQNISKF